MLSKEKDCQFEATFVRNKFVHALSIEDHKLLEEVVIVMQREDEHKKKLKEIQRSENISERSM